ncbi:hypothetical protein [Photobacterium leiognathi]|uniref:hypothetical protein n=1 Tax=Photobacterium leiognathi TaxID=553611 RepID=UPI002980A874|nr:hypothetical protein [Photobacterium leiognathi]
MLTACMSYNALADEVDSSDTVIWRMNHHIPRLTKTSIMPSLRMISGTILPINTVDKQFSNIAGQNYYVDRFSELLPIDISNMNELPKTVTIQLRGNEKRSRAYTKRKYDQGVGDFRLGTVKVSFGYSTKSTEKTNRDDVPLVDNDTNQIPDRASDRTSPYTDFTVKTGTIPFKGIADAYSSFLGLQAVYTSLKVNQRNGDVRVTKHYRDVVNAPVMYSAKGYLKTLDNDLTSGELVKVPWRYRTLYVRFESDSYTNSDDISDSAKYCASFEKGVIPNTHGWFHILDPFSLTELSYDFHKKSEVPTKCEKQLLRLYPLNYIIYIS